MQWEWTIVDSSWTCSEAGEGLLALSYGTGQEREARPFIRGKATAGPGLGKLDRIRRWLGIQGVGKAC